MNDETQPTAEKVAEKPIKKGLSLAELTLIGLVSGNSLESGTVWAAHRRWIF